MYEHLPLLDEDLLETRAKLLGSLLLFTRFFYKLRTGREFIISEPLGRESHYITIAKALSNIFYCRQKDTFINIPPRYGKTEMMIHYMAWSYAHNPSCNNIYVSFENSVAVRVTATVRDILQMPIYKKLFGLEIRHDINAKGYFCTTLGGETFGYGAGGPITSKGAGILGSKEYAGALMFDDIHKPKDIHSDTIRESEIRWFDETFNSRRNDPINTPRVGIGQRLREGDIFDILKEDSSWNGIILPALDDAGNVLDPKRHTKEMLIHMERTSPDVYWAQYQQQPQPAGGGIFKEDWFVLLDEEPDIIATFITADTAETSKNYNDATVFSFWGVYKIKHGEIETDLCGLHWLDCVEIRIETCDLYPEFMQFYSGCLRHSIKPKVIAIEKKSSGVTLLSTLKKLQGMTVIDIERTIVSGSKTARFNEIQTYVASRQISFTRFAKHVNKCITHCKKITKNDTHANDDIADTLYDAVKIALINEYDFPNTYKPIKDEIKAKQIMHQFNAIKKIRTSYGSARI